MRRIWYLTVLYFSFEANNVLCCPPSNDQGNTFVVSEPSPCSQETICNNCVSNSRVPSTVSSTIYTSPPLNTCSRSIYSISNIPYSLPNIPYPSFYPNNLLQPLLPKPTVSVYSPLSLISQYSSLASTFNFPRIFNPGCVNSVLSPSYVSPMLSQQTILQQPAFSSPFPPTILPPSLPTNSGCTNSGPIVKKIKINSSNNYDEYGTEEAIYVDNNANTCSCSQCGSAYD